MNYSTIHKRLVKECFTLEYADNQLEQIEDTIQTTSTYKGKECSLSTAYYKDHYYFTLTKKTPQEALSGCTTINFLGLEKSQVEPFVGFLITMINELES